MSTFSSTARVENSSWKCCCLWQYPRNRRSRAPAHVDRHASQWWFRYEYQRRKTSSNPHSYKPLIILRSALQFFRPIIVTLLFHRNLLWLSRLTQTSEISNSRWTNTYWEYRELTDRPVSECDQIADASVSERELHRRPLLDLLSETGEKCWLDFFLCDHDYLFVIRKHLQQIPSDLCISFYLCQTLHPGTFLSLSHVC